MESYKRLKAGNSAYFAQSMPSRQHWRLFPDFRGSIAYLDIETNGLAGASGYITTISLYDGNNVHYYVKGRNLEDFKKDILKYKLLVTYNGKCFDIPVIESEFRIKLDQAHIDLRFVLRDLGFTGGLKGCEKKLGIDRGDLDGVDGFFAVLLWNDYRRKGNKKSLETLLAYNIQDAVNLEPLMITSYNLKLRGTPFRGTHEIELPKAPESPLRADVETVERIFSENSWHYCSRF